MDNKITKERIEKHLEYDWYKYILIIVAVIFLWYFIFSVTENLPSEKELSFFTVSCSVDSGVVTKIEQDKEHLLGEDALVEEFIFSTYANDSNLGAVMLTAALTSDILIAPAAVFSRYAGQGFFLDLEVLQEDGYFDESDWQAVNDTDAFYTHTLTEEEKAEGIDASVNGKKFGISIHKLCANLFFKDVYIVNDETQDEEPVEFIMGFIAPNLSKAQGGGNKGKYNASKQSDNYDSFKFVKSLLAKDNDGAFVFEKYRAIV